MQQQNRGVNAEQQLVLLVPVVNDSDYHPAVQFAAVNLPCFWSDNPSLWFSQSDSQSTIFDVSTEVMKFHNFGSQLDAHIPVAFKDITNPTVQIEMVISV
ncbi:hypothetical protein J6590_054810 [Homalodisca vitripennis]|nr:hypothetical protein J6590_054810 [Homalodisca vitripennis]